MSDIFWQALIGGVVTIILALMSQRNTNAIVKVGDDAKKASDEAASIHAQTAAHLSQKLSAIANVGEKTHILVNSAMGSQKKLLAVTARAKAKVTLDPVDVIAAEVAEAELAHHESRQALMDEFQDKLPKP